MLENMRKGSVPDIVKEGRCDGILAYLPRNLDAVGDKALDETAHHPHRAHTMPETRVFGTVIRKPTRPKLQDPSKTLELGRVDKRSEVTPILRPQGDESMDRISENVPSWSPSFLSLFRRRVPPSQHFRTKRRGPCYPDR